MVRIIIFCCVILFVTGCHILYRPNFSINKPIEKDQLELRINGVYIATYKDRETCIFFYKNGNMQGTRNSENIDLYKYYRNEENIERSNNNSASYPVGWGKYEINGDNLIIEQIWMKKNKYQVLKYRGRIINDTTIMVKDYFYRADSIFYFHPLVIKPDSVSRYVD